ncbi:(2Fe-2S)-binding protein [Corallococcus praedator]|uniref:(2Fe-2S)-binding protein n=1 Tax=Corallococcus praedator TaxID=2316724 RepID=A0ABX9QCY5_9BACT|nr:MULTISPECIES: Rieske 2Fe-2S domain-containing protein [Corallococcus]RKH25475.1 (2Fe-2S)-binding protein [Corallococcus sp. CA031C]RKI02501.1 (2Fe-2S)-binding protein [Corallococcus praedator]
MAVPVPAGGDAARLPGPVRPRAWYLVGPSASLRRGQARGVQVGGRELVVFRGDAGQVHALEAHCPHLGAHLKHGTVQGELLRCPLHHWSFDGAGRCRAVPGRKDVSHLPGPQAFPVEERFGALLVFSGPTALFPPPDVGGPEHVWNVGPPVTVRCPWLPLAANSFDLEHLRTVHHRELRDVPTLDTPDPFTLRLRYTSRVVGTGASDRLMKALSGNHIRVTLTLHGGTLMSVQSDLGRARGLLLAGLTPVPEGVSVRLAVAARRGRVPGATALALKVSRWLYTSFLRRDLSVLDGMRFNVATATADPVMRQLIDFAIGLPEDPADALR